MLSRNAAESGFLKVLKMRRVWSSVEHYRIPEIVPFAKRQIRHEIPSNMRLWFRLENKYPISLEDNRKISKPRGAGNLEIVVCDLFMQFARHFSGISKPHAGKKNKISDVTKACYPKENYTFLKLLSLIDLERCNCLGLYLKRSGMREWRLKQTFSSSFKRSARMEQGKFHRRGRSRAQKQQQYRPCYVWK